MSHIDSLEHRRVFSVHSPAKGDDLVEGLAFLDQKYREVFGVSPSPPDHLLVARHGRRVAGTIGVNFSHPVIGLRLANLYQFDHARTPMPMDIDRAVDFGRLVCEMPGASGILIHEAICFSLSYGKMLVLCEHTVQVNRTCRRFGIAFHAIEGAVLDPSRIEEHHRTFYEENDVHLYMFDLAQARDALESYLKRQ